MSDQPDNIVLVYLRRLDAKMDQVIDTVNDHGRRLTALEIAFGNMVATEASHYANIALRLDGVERRLDRIERRLELRFEAR